MRALVLVRRVAIFCGVAGAGMAVVVWAAGGLRLEQRRGANLPLPRASTVSADLVAQRGGARLGPGRSGRLDRDDVVVVGSRAVPWREFTALWETSRPVASRDAGVSLQELGGARLVFFPRPSDEDPVATTREDAPGVTQLTGDEALLRRRENGPASATVRGNCVASHQVAPGEAMVLRSDELELRTEERGPQRQIVRVVQTDSPVQLESGGSVLTGTGLDAELDGGKRAGAQRKMRIRSDVRGTLRGRSGRAGAESEIRVECDGAADVEALDRATRDGRQPWRATFREDVQVEDADSSMTCDELVAEFVRTGTTDRKAGAASTEVRSLTATGDVRLDGRGDGALYHAECARLRRFAEDAVTDVMVLEGDPVLRWEGRAQAATEATSVYEARCKGPATLRARRNAARPDAPAKLTLVFEGDVVVLERATADGDLRSEMRAPLLTIEGTRAEGGRIDPQLVRAERGATARYGDFSAQAQTIVATAAAPGANRRFALVGRPEAAWKLAGGAGPFGGDDGEGTLQLTSNGRIDAEVAADPPAGTKPTGTRVAAHTSEGFVARRLSGTDEAWRLTAESGDAKIGWDGAIEEMHASGNARLNGRGRRDDRRGDLAGGRITVTRRPGETPKGPDARRALDAVVDGSAAAPATASLTEAGDDSRRDEVRALQLVHTEGGTVLLARGSAAAQLHRSGAGEGSLAVTADEMRVDLEPGGDGPDAVRRLTATGRVRIGDAMHALVGDRATYDPVSGEAEVWGAPAELVRREDPQFPSHARGPRIRAWFDAKAAGADRFQRANLPDGGEIVAYFAAPARQRVTVTSRGPMDMSRTAATAIGSAICVYESRLDETRWNADSRIDAARVDLTFDPTVAGGKMSEKIRTLVATGTPESPARIRTRDAAGGREAYAEAERIEGSQWDTKLRLTCPSERSDVYLHQVSEARRVRCDSVVFDYVTYEWSEMLRARGVE